MQSAIKAMVTTGQLTNAEKLELLEKLKTNTTNPNPTKILAIENIKPITYTLRYHEDIIKLRVKVMLIVDMEAKSRNTPLTLADLKIIEEKPDLIEEVDRYETASRGWFCEDAEFQLQCAATEKEAIKKFEKRLNSKPKSKKSTSSSTSTTKSTGGGWSTAGSASGKKTTASVKPTPTTSGFAAAFNMDSDSD